MILEGVERHLTLHLRCARVSAKSQLPSSPAGPARKLDSAVAENSLGSHPEQVHKRKAGLLKAGLVVLKCHRRQDTINNFQTVQQGCLTSGRMSIHLVHVHVHAFSSNCILLDCTPDLDLLLQATQAAFHCKRMHRFQSGVIYVEEKMARWHKSEVSSTHKTSDGSLLTSVDPVIVAPRLPPLWRNHFAHPDVPNLGTGVQIFATLLQKSRMPASNVHEEKNDGKRQSQGLSNKTVFHSPACRACTHTRGSLRIPPLWA